MSSNKYSLEGKNILVTGATSGIGKSIAQVLDSQLGNIAITGRDPERLKETFDNLTGLSKKNFLCDLTIDFELDELISQLPSLDGIVFCAGIIEYIPGKFSTSEKIRNIFNVNYDAQIALYQKLHKAKKINKKASLIFISSISSQIGTPGTLIYASSKAALNASVRVLASELAPLGIRVNSISPGIIKSPMIEKAGSSIEQEVFAKAESNYPLGYGEPADVAYAAAFLLSDASKWITGINLVVDGGFTLK
jgi:NAD(P)-dependent dehydrogenase (short-subunit alcohol dehydrogenase family)